MDMMMLADALAAGGDALPGAKPKAIPGLAPVITELFGYGLYIMVIAGGVAIGIGFYKLSMSDKSRSGGGSEPFKWMGSGVVTVMVSGVLISIVNGIAA